MKNRGRPMIDDDVKLSAVAELRVAGKAKSVRNAIVQIVGDNDSDIRRLQRKWRYVGAEYVRQTIKRQANESDLRLNRRLPSRISPFPQKLDLPAFKAMQIAQGMQGSKALREALDLQAFNTMQIAQGMQRFKALREALDLQAFNTMQVAQGMQGFKAMREALDSQAFNTMQVAQGMQGFKAMREALDSQAFNTMQVAQGMQAIKAMRGALGLPALKTIKEILYPPA